MDTNKDGNVNITEITAFMLKVILAAYAGAWPKMSPQPCPISVLAEIRVVSDTPFSLSLINMAITPMQIGILHAR